MRAPIEQVLPDATRLPKAVVRAVCPKDEEQREGAAKQRVHLEEGLRRRLPRHPVCNRVKERDTERRSRREQQRLQDAAQNLSGSGAGVSGGSRRAGSRCASTGRALGG